MRKKKETGGINLLDFRLYYKATVIQSSMLLAQRQKYRSMEKNKKIQRYIHAPKDTFSLTKEARIYNGEKTISLTSGAGKTGQPLVKQ